MTSRSTLSLLMVATLLGLSWAGSMEDQLYGSVRAPADEPSSSSEQQHGRPGRDSWQKLATDALQYLNIFSSSSGAIEKSLKKLCEKVERELDLGKHETYSMHYAKQLLNEQRAVIEALRAGVSAPVTATPTVDTTKKVPSVDEILQKTDQFVRPLMGSSAASNNQVTKELSTEHDKLIQALQSLQSLKF